MTNHAMNNEMAKIMIAPLVGTVEHASMNKTVKILILHLFVWYMQWTPSTVQMKTDQELYCIFG